MSLELLDTFLSREKHHKILLHNKYFKNIILNKFQKKYLAE